MKHCDRTKVKTILLKTLKFLKMSKDFKKRRRRFDEPK